MKDKTKAPSDGGKGLLLGGAEGFAPKWWTPEVRSRWMRENLDAFNRGDPLPHPRHEAPEDLEFEDHVDRFYQIRGYDPFKGRVDTDPRTDVSGVEAAREKVEGEWSEKDYSEENLYPTEEEVRGW